MPITSSGVYALGGDNVLTLVDTPFRYRDVYSGLDDKLYALDVNGSDVGRFNASTLGIDTFFTLATPVNASLRILMALYRALVRTGSFITSTALVRFSGRRGSPWTR